MYTIKAVVKKNRLNIKDKGVVRAFVSSSNSNFIITMDKEDYVDFIKEQIELKRMTPITPVFYKFETDEIKIEGDNTYTFFAENGLQFTDTKVTVKSIKAFNDLVNSFKHFKNKNGVSYEPEYTITAIAINNK